MVGFKAKVRVRVRVWIMAKISFEVGVKVQV